MVEPHFRLAEWNTASCLATAARNNRIVLLHGLAQLILVALGGWRLGRSTQARVAFLLISIPWSGVVLARTCDESISPAPNERRI